MLVVVSYDIRVFRYEMVGRMAYALTPSTGIFIVLCEHTTTGFHISPHRRCIIADLDVIVVRLGLKAIEANADQLGSFACVGSQPRHVVEVNTERI